MVQGEETSSDGIDVAVTSAALRAMRVAVVNDSLDDLIPALSTDTSGTDTALGVMQALEELKNAISARQAELAVAWHEKQRRRDLDRNAGLPARHPQRIHEDDTARLVGSQLGMARRTSPARGTHLLRLAHRLTRDLPHTFAALQAGSISEWQASLVTRETRHLDHEQAGAVDEALSGELGKVSDRRLEEHAHELALTLDPEAASAARHQAETGRHVTLRRAPESMTRLCALLPMVDGLRLMTALTGAVQAIESMPEESRTRGQLMADGLVTAVTGAPASLAPSPNPEANTDVTAEPAAAAPVAVNLLVPLGTLVGDAPARLEGFGPIPADLARELIEKSGERVRRIFTDPDSGDLISMESKSRHYPGLLATFIRLRDQHCRTAHCSAAITQIDHIHPHHAGGDTSETNGRGTCTTCNLVKEHPDYTVTGDARQTTTVTGGLQVTSEPPAPPGRFWIDLPDQPPPRRRPPLRGQTLPAWLSSIDVERSRAAGRRAALQLRPPA